MKFQLPQAKLPHCSTQKCQKDSQWLTSSRLVPNAWPNECQQNFITLKFAFVLASILELLFFCKFPYV